MRSFIYTRALLLHKPIPFVFFLANKIFVMLPPTAISATIWHKKSSQVSNLWGGGMVKQFGWRNFFVIKDPRMISSQKSCLKFPLTLVAGSVRGVLQRLGLLQQVFFSFGRLGQNRGQKLQNKQSSSDQEMKWKYHQCRLCRLDLMFTPLCSTLKNEALQKWAMDFSLMFK